MLQLMLFTSMVSSLMLHSHSRRVPICSNAILRSLTQLSSQPREDKDGPKLPSEPEDSKTYQSATESEISSEYTEPTYNSTKELESSKLMLPIRAHGLSSHVTNLHHLEFQPEMPHMHSQEEEPLKRNKMLPSKPH